MLSNKLKSYEFYEWAKYQWEFIRRSPGYKKLYYSKLKDKAESEASKLVYRDPSLSFEELIDSIDSGSGELVNMMYVLNSIIPSSVDFSFGPGKMKIEIDFEKINLFESLKKYICSLVDTQIKIQKTLNPKMKNNKRLNMTDYDLILLVGDLKEKGTKNKEIAQHIEPRRYRSNPESAIRSVSRYWKIYRELVNGGYSNLTYP